MARISLRTALIALAVVLVSAAGAFGVIFLVMRRPLDPRPASLMKSLGRQARDAAGGAAVSTRTARPRTADDTTEGGGYTIESTLPPGVDAGDAVLPPSRAVSMPAEPAIRVAYVRDRKLCVADEDGKNERVMLKWRAGGTYHLSPDGRRIAYSLPDEAGTRLLLYVSDIGGRAARVQDLAKGSDFAWAPDGRRIAGRFVATSGSQVRDLGLGLVSTTGSGGTTRFGVSGYDPVFSPGGKRIAFFSLAPGKTAGPSGLWRIDTSGDTTVAVLPGLGVASAAWLDDETLVAVRQGTAAIPDQLVRVRADGTRMTVLATNGNDRLRSLHNVITGGDGGSIAYDLVGDDGYSRIYTIGPDGRGLRLLPGGRDVYPVGWTDDGERLLFVEGNASQGEPTALVSASPAGSGKRFVVMGGGL